MSSLFFGFSLLFWFSFYIFLYSVSVPDTAVNLSISESKPTIGAAQILHKTNTGNKTSWNDSIHWNDPVWIPEVPSSDEIPVSDAITDALPVAFRLWGKQELDFPDEFYMQSGDEIISKFYEQGSDGCGNMMIELELAEHKILRVDICYTDSIRSRYLVQGFENEDPCIAAQQIPKILEELCQYEPDHSQFEMLIRLIRESEGTAESDLNSYFNGSSNWHYLKSEF